MKTFLSLFLVCSISFGQATVELRNESINFKSRDLIYAGQLNTASVLNPMILGRINLIPSSVGTFFLEGRYQQVTLSDKFMNNKLNMSRFDIGYRFRLVPQYSFETVVGVKDHFDVTSNNSVLTLSKVNVFLIGVRVSKALTKAGPITLFGDGLLSFYPHLNDRKGSEVGIGLSAGTNFTKGVYGRIGYRLEYDTIDLSAVSNSLFRNCLYLKLNF